MVKQLRHSSLVREITQKDGVLSIGRPRESSALKRTRRRRGHEIASDLLNWASVDGTDAAKRISEILEIIVELAQAHRTNPVGREQTFSWQGLVFTAKTDAPNNGSLPKVSARDHELRLELNHRLSAYKLMPHYWCTLGDRPILAWTSMKERPRDRDEPAVDVSFTEEDAIIRILDLARDGLLFRVRRCVCGDWFLAGFIHQKFCCKRCQQGHFRSSAEYKDRRRVYMKNLRAQHKERWHPESAAEAVKHAKRTSSILLSKGYGKKPLGPS